MKNCFILLVVALKIVMFQDLEDQIEKKQGYNKNNRRISYSAPINNKGKDILTTEEIMQGTGKITMRLFSPNGRSIRAAHYKFRVPIHCNKKITFILKGKIYSTESQLMLFKWQQIFLMMINPRNLILYSSLIQLFYPDFLFYSVYYHFSSFRNP